MDGAGKDGDMRGVPVPAAAVLQNLEVEYLRFRVGDLPTPCWGRATRC